MSLPDRRLIEDQAVWARAWRACGWRARRRIKAAIARGLALEDPAEAALAVGWIHDARHLEKRYSAGLSVGTGGAFEAQLENAHESNMAVLRKAWGDE